MLILVIADKHNILTIFFYYVDDALCIKTNNNSYIIKRIQKFELTDNKRLTANVNKSLCCSNAKSCTHSRTADDNGNIRLFNHGHPPLQQLPQKICTSFVGLTPPKPTAISAMRAIPESLSPSPTTTIG